MFENDLCGEKEFMIIKEYHFWLDWHDFFFKILIALKKTG